VEWDIHQGADQKAGYRAYRHTVRTYESIDQGAIGHAGKWRPNITWQPKEWRVPLLKPQEGLGRKERALPRLVERTGLRTARPRVTP
jgi:hypothetical protein